ncbi:MAG TPA: ATP-binding protein [Chloroflexota bacterium]|nr:ATP-binding protein [Chloroflexota bacterium]
MTRAAAPAVVESALAGTPEGSNLKAQLAKLGLHSMAVQFEAEADRAAKSESTYSACLTRLVEAELADKTDRSVNARTARARFPVLRTLEEFDFAFQPGLSAPRIRELANLGFINQAANIVMVGEPGVGKTHLAIALGLRACQARRSVRFAATPQLLDQLVAADVSHTLGKLLDQLGRLDLLVIDELASPDGRAPRQPVLPAGRPEVHQVVAPDQQRRL